ncbi:hypothetical protein N9V68_01265 [Octadecabacter sp.]|nr:hypothetical protein [Octadecabacter sp.]
MSRTDVLSNWPAAINPLCSDFPYLQPAALHQFQGDRARIEAHLARTHDLTHGEAVEVLDDWLFYNGPRLNQDAGKAA